MSPTMSMPVSLSALAMTFSFVSGLENPDRSPGSTAIPTTVLPRRQSDAPAEGLVKMGEVVEAGLDRDVGERAAGAQHEPMGLVEAEIADVVAQRPAEHGVEGVRERRAAHRGHGGQT